MTKEDTGKTVVMAFVAIISLIISIFLFSIAIYTIVDFIGVSVKYGGITSFAKSEGYTFWRAFYAALCIVLGKILMDLGLGDLVKIKNR